MTMRFKLLTNKESKSIYSFDAIDGTGTFAINKKDGAIELLNHKCRLPEHELDKKTLDHILYIGKRKILENNFPDQCIYATH